jgi:acetyl esterase/lipase
MMRARFACLLFLLCAGPLSAQIAPTYSNLPYAQVGGRNLALDLYLPAGSSPPLPLTVWIHGGGWQSGDKFPLPASAAQLLTRGIAVASVNYRLTGQAGQFGSEPVTFPAQIHDIKAALRYLRANAARYGFDPGRIAVWGASAGGHLAALAATSGNAPQLEGTVGTELSYSSRVEAAVDYFGPIDLLQMNPDVTTPPGSVIEHDAVQSPESRLIGFDAVGQGIGVLRANLANPAAPYPAYALLVASTNPISFLDPSDPPQFIGHGDADTSVPLMQSQRLDSALSAQGVAHQFVTAAGFGHGFLGNATDAAAQDFLATKLATKAISGALSGAWYDPNRSGEGLLLSVETDGTRRVLIATWYTYRAGAQQWLFGSVDLANGASSAVVPMVVTAGADFGANFHAGEVMRTPWGDITLTWLGCTSLRLDYAPSSGAPGTLTLSRILPQIDGLKCD